MAEDNPISNQLMGIGNTYATGQVQGQQNDKAHERTVELMHMQYGNQRNLNKQGSNLQYENWVKTGAPKQVELLKEAGLNPALMYKQGGAQGTTGSQTGGSAGMGQTKIAPYMDIAGLMEQASRTRLNNAHSNAIENKLPEEISNIKEDTNKKNAERLTSETQAELNKVIAKSKNQDIAESMKRVENLSAQQKLTEEQTKLAKQQNAVNRVKMDLDKAGIKLTEQKTKESMEGVKVMWRKFGLDREDVKTRKNQANVQKFTAEMKTKYPSLWSVFGKLINDGTRLGQEGEQTLDNLLWWFGMSREDREEVEFE